VSEGGGGRRVSQIVSGHVDGLDGSDGTLLGGGDTLLHHTHVDGESGLVSDSRGDTSEKSGHLRTGLGETEDVVNEEKHILALLITEVPFPKVSDGGELRYCCLNLLSDGKTSESDTGTSSRGLVHLTEHKGDLGLALEVDDTGLLHFVVQIVTLTGTLADTAEHGVTTVSLSDVVLDSH
jgi:hypothetical protein